MLGELLKQQAGCNFIVRAEGSSFNIVVSLPSTANQFGSLIVLWVNRFAGQIIMQAYTSQHISQMHLKIRSRNSICLIRFLKFVELNLLLYPHINFSLI